MDITIVLIVVLLVVLGAVAWIVMQRRRSEALRERLNKREAPYVCVFDALVHIVKADRNPDALKALLQEPDDNPNDLEALDRAWAEEQVTFGPDTAGCPKADILKRMKGSVA